MSILRFLVNYDYFGGAFELTVEGHSRTKTVVGFFFSLAFTAIILLATFKFSYQYFDVSRPRVLIKDIRNDTYPNITLNHDPIYYFFSVHGPNGFVSSDDIPSYVNMIVRYEDITANPNGTLNVRAEEVRMEPCSQTEWVQKVAPVMNPNHQKIATTFGLCAKDSQSQFLLFKGTDPPYGHIEIQIRRCEQGAACKTSGEISDLVFILYTVEHYFNSSNRKEPLHHSSEAKTRFRIRPGERTEYRYFIQDMQVASDDGIFSKLFDYKYGYQWSHPKVDKRKLYSSDAAYVHLNIYSSGRHIEYTRVYYKLLDLFSDIGGVIQVISFIITVLYSNYNEYVQRKNLIRYGVLGKSRRKQMASNALSKGSAKVSPAELKPKTHPVTPMKLDNSVGKRRDDALYNGMDYPQRPIEESVHPQAPTHKMEDGLGWDTPELAHYSNLTNSKKHSKLAFGELAKARSKKLFNFDDYEFEDSVKLGLISRKVIESSDEMTNKRAAFYQLCEKQLDSLTDIYNMCSNLNSLTNLKDIVMLREHKVLAHYAALEFIHNEDSMDTDISYRDAIKELLLTEPTNTVQRLLNEYMIEKVRLFENRFNGEVNNVLRDVQRNEVRSELKLRQSVNNL